MKKILVLAIVAFSLFGCKKQDPKDVFHERLIGVWLVTDTRLNPNDVWVDVSSANDVFNITKCAMEPYKDSYHILSASSFEIPIGSSDWGAVSVEFVDDQMIWTFEDSSQLKLRE